MARAKTTTSVKITARKAEAAGTEQERKRPLQPTAPTHKAGGSTKRPSRSLAAAAPQPSPVATSPVATPALQPAPAAEQAPGSKQAGIVAALRRPQGATIAELMQLTGWLSHSVRGVLAGALKRKLGLVIDSRVEPDRGRTYRIVQAAKAARSETGLEPSPAPPKARRAKLRGGAAQAAA